MRGVGGCFGPRVVFKQFAQIHVFRQYGQVPSQLLRAGVREGRPFVLGHGDIQPRHRRGNFPREIGVQPRVIIYRDGVTRYS